MNSSLITTLGIKLYNSGQIDSAIKYFLKAVEIDANIKALYHLCDHDIKYDSSFDMISIISENLKYIPVSPKLELLQLLYKKYPNDVHLMYIEMLLLPLNPDIRYYVLEMLCFKPPITNADLGSKFEFLKELLKIKVTDITICRYILTRSYSITTDPVTPVDIDLDEYFKVSDYKYVQPKIVIKRNKIYVGFVTADMNKMGTSIFYNDIINFLDPKKFETFVYYDDTNESMNVQTVKTNNHVSWVPIYKKRNDTVYNQIHDIHKIDILIDLLSFKHPPRIRLFVMRPAKIQINYTFASHILGYYTHALTDKYSYCIVPSTVTNVHLRYTQWLINFGNTRISIDFQANKLVHDYKRTLVGIVNPVSHMSLKCILLYNAISAKYPVTFVVSGDHIPNLKNAVYSCDDKNVLFNSVDYMIDSFPYSVVNMTAAALYMGCPVLTFYQPNATQTSNASSSINFNCGLDKYVFKTTSSILKFKFRQFRDGYNRKCIRKSFLNVMNKEKFMDNFEDILLKAT